MKKIIIAIFSLCLALSVVSCQEELKRIDNGGNQEGTASSLEVSGSIVTTSKVNAEYTVDEEGDRALQPYWELGDIVYGYFDNGTTGSNGAHKVTALKYKVVAVDEDGVAKFFWAGEGSEPDIALGTKVYMVYGPVVGEVSEYGQIRIEYGDQDGTRHDALKHACMTAEGTVVANPDQAGHNILDLRFYNMMSIFKISGLQYPVLQEDGVTETNELVPVGTTINITSERGFTDCAYVLSRVRNYAPAKFEFGMIETNYFASVKVKTLDEDGVACAYFALPSSEKWNTSFFWHPKWKTSGTADTGIIEFTLATSIDNESFYWKDSRTASKSIAVNKCYNLAKGAVLKRNGHGTPDMDVVFGPGNLQYRKYEEDGEWKEMWRFAPNTYDIIGDGNIYIEDIKGGYHFKHIVSGTPRPYSEDPDPKYLDRPYYQDWIDMFGYGATGYEKTLPYMIQFASTDDGKTSWEFCYPTANIKDTEYDWGRHIKTIMTARNHDPEQMELDPYNGQWRTLTQQEWEYIRSREAAVVGFSPKQGFAAIYADKSDLKNNIAPIAVGCVILPNAFIDPKLNFQRYDGDYVDGSFLAKDNWKNDVPNNYNRNCYDLEGWAAMEAAGAVFLPACGERIGAASGAEYSSAMNYYDTQHNLIGAYWSSTGYDKGNRHGQAAYFTGAALMSIHNWSIVRGCAVRLVRDANARPVFPQSLDDNQ